MTFKLKLTIIAIALFFVSSSNVYAQTKTPTTTEKPTPTGKTIDSKVKETTPTGTEEAELNRIQKIKDMVASRVAELKLVEKRGILGIVKKVSNTQIEVKDDKGEERKIDIDELTKFQKSSSSKDDDESFGVSDIKTGDEVAFVGLYNKQTDRLLARVVILPKSIPLYFVGAVKSLDPKAFEITVANDKESKIVDFEKSTVSQMYSKEDGAAKSGFSKIEEGQRILVVGFEDSKNNHLIATRLLHFIDVPPKSADLNSSAPVEEASPSATLTPTRAVRR